MKVKNGENRVFESEKGGSTGLKENMIIQLTFWTPNYEQRIVDRVRSVTCCSNLSNTEIIRLLWIAHTKWQFYPDGIWGIIRHHQPDDEPMDDWFISRITEMIHRAPDCL